MKKVTMLEFRRRAESVLEQVRKGQGFLLTYRGKPVATLQPVVEQRSISSDDPIYHLDELASDTAEPLTNAEMDRIVYGA